MSLGYEALKEELKKNRVNPKWEDISKLVYSISKNKRVANMVLEAVNLSGLEGNIVPSHSHKGYSVELVSGYNFNVSTYPQISSENGGRWERRNVRVLVIDGVVEKESEIHNIFTRAYEEDEPLLLVARGYGEEVIATIMANKKLDICPIRGPFEVESINIVTDISVVCGSFMVTPMKGDIINNTDYDELPTVEQIICTKESLNIVDSNYVRSVNNHVNDLSERRDKYAQEKAELLSKRIKSLCSHTVHLRVGSKSKQEAIKELEAVDFSLRLVKGILDKGIVDPSKTIAEFGKYYKMRPTISVLSAAHHGISLAKSLAFTEIAIMSD
jgi:chaperonin GroEL (HSP60 family)